MAAMLAEIWGHPTWRCHTFYKKYSEIMFANNSSKKCFLAPKLSQSWCLNCFTSSWVLYLIWQRNWYFNTFKNVVAVKELLDLKCLLKLKVQCYNQNLWSFSHNGTSVNLWCLDTCQLWRNVSKWLPRLNSMYGTSNKNVQWTPFLTSYYT